MFLNDTMAVKERGDIALNHDNQSTVVICESVLLMFCVALLDFALLHF
jgi:hypothetical protein